MLKKVMLSVVMVMCFASLAMATAYPDNPCNVGGFDPPDNCVHMFYLHDMGHFDGDVWVWDQDFVDAHGGQLQWTPQCGGDLNTNTPADWQTCLQPYKEATPTRLRNLRVDRRKYADETKDHTRLSFTVDPAVTSTMMPFLYWDGVNNGIWMDIVDNDGDGVGESILFIQGQRDPAFPETPSVTAVYWNEKGTQGTEYLTERDETYRYLKYNTGLRDWENVGEEIEQYTLHYYKFFDEVQAGETNTFDVVLEGGETLTGSVYISNTDEMPKIPAYITETVSPVSKSGKAIKGLTNNIDVENIVVREVLTPSFENALVIQWGEPDGALFGNKYNFVDTDDTFMLRVYIGQWIDRPEYTQEAYLWIDCPVQTGTVVVGPEDYQWLINKLSELGMSTNDIHIQLIYRTVTDRDGSQDNGNYHNRGYSDDVLFTPTF